MPDKKTTTPVMPMAKPSANHDPMGHPDPKMTDILRAAADAAEFDVAQTAMSAHENEELGESFDTGPLQPEEEPFHAGDGEQSEMDQDLLQSGDHVTVTYNLMHQGERLGIEVSSVDKTDPAEHDPVLLRATALGIEFGPANEFTERRIARLREEQEELRQACVDIDTQIAHLNARRTDAMLAFSGVSADLTALGVYD